MMALNWIVFIAFLLAILSTVALHSRGVMRVLIGVQVVYWIISYIARPLVLLLVNPAPAVNDSVADARLAYSGYDESLPRVLAPIAFGLFIYVIAVLILRRLFRSRFADFDSVQPKGMAASAFVVAYVIGWAARLSPFSDINSAVATLTYLGTIGGVGLLVFGRRTGNAAALMSSIFALELAWSLLSASKTPILAAIVAIAIRFGILGWSRKNKLAVVLLGAVSIAGFSFLQNVKLSQGVQQDLLGADSAYPPIVAPFMPIIRRFDLLSAMTDAVYLGDAKWMSTTEAVGTALQGLVPRQFLHHEKISAGSSWALEVRPASTGVINPDVSLADGYIAEGYAINGLWGVVIGALFIACLLMLATRLLQSSSIFALSLGILLVSYPALYERGIFGGLEILGKSLQASVVVWIIHTLFIVVATRMHGNGIVQGRLLATRDLRSWAAN